MKIKVTSINDLIVRCSAIVVLLSVSFIIGNLILAILAFPIFISALDKVSIALD